MQKAWKLEYDNVYNGGAGISRVWEDTEKAELLAFGKVKGYHGHHMYSVQAFPSLAASPANIQFLTPTEHLKAHGGNWRNVTFGRYLG